MAPPWKPKETAETCQLRMKGAGEGLAGGPGGEGARRKLGIRRLPQLLPDIRHCVCRAEAALQRGPQDWQCPTDPHTLPSALLVTQRSNRERDGQEAFSWSRSTRCFGSSDEAKPVGCGRVVGAKLGGRDHIPRTAESLSRGSLSWEGSFPESPSSSPEGRSSPSRGAPLSQGSRQGKGGKRVQTDLSMGPAG